MHRFLERREGEFFNVTFIIQVYWRYTKSFMKNKMHAKKVYLMSQIAIKTCLFKIIYNAAVILLIAKAKEHWDRAILLKFAIFRVHVSFKKLPIQTRIFPRQTHSLCRLGSKIRAIWEVTIAIFRNVHWKEFDVTKYCTWWEKPKFPLYY